MLDPTQLNATLDEIAGGNRNAFWHIVRAYSLPLRSYLASQTQHAHDIDDLAQEVFFAAFANLGTFRREDDFGAWLRGIARNMLFAHWRKTTRRNKALDGFREEVARIVEPELDRAASNDRPEAIENLLRCITQLPEKLRRVVRSGLDGDKPTALAEELATTVGAIYNLQYRANQMLRACMQKETS